MRVSAEVNDSSGPPIMCFPDNIAALPGELVRFIVTNNTDQQIEVIVADQEGLDKRKESIAEVSSGIDESSERSLKEIASSYFRVHDGHEDEEGPNATEDYRYRMLISPLANNIVDSNVSSMLVTFPEIGEFAPFEYFLCAYPSSLDLFEGSITRR